MSAINLFRSFGLCSLLLSWSLCSGCAKPAPPAPVSSGQTAPTVDSSDTPAEAPAALSTSVTLGDAYLTAGIPGEGDLTVDQITQWLGTEGVHESLEFTLPFGLSAASIPVEPIEKNPLTRAKIELGRQLYFDKRLSADNTVSCADCHHPDEGFAKHTQFGVGINGLTGNRNSPISYNRIVSTAQFWDGRAASLEEQAVGPIQAGIEMGNTHEEAVKTIQGIAGYVLQFEAVFPDEKVTIDTIGKAIATFERAIVTGTAPYDSYELLRTFEKANAEDLEDLEELKEEDPDLLEQYQAIKAESEKAGISESAIRGREIFFTDKGACTACHAGANFADEKYHNLGIGMDAEKPDLGRFEVTKEEKDKGAFKTPTIRNCELSAPYMHDGSLATLEEVVEWYAKGGHANPNLSEKMKKLKLTDQDKKDLVEFMKACTGPFPKIETGRLP